MKRSWIGRTRLVTLLVLAAGCGTPCQGARERIDSRYAECGITVVNPGDPTNEECTAADGELQTCVANCVESATCEALTGDDATGSADFGECLVDCSG